MKYILASASERRQELLKRIVDDFDIIVSKFDEEEIKFDDNVEEYVIKIAEGKALEVLSRTNEDCIIIAADTIVVNDDKILGKPKDEKDAYDMLKSLSGKVHRVYSGVVVINSKTSKVKKECIFTEVKFKALTNEEILNYISTKEPLDKAGAYGIQGFGGVFVERINGCYYNVVGLPLNLLNNILEEIK
ncbi:MAG: Maf-like protein [Clostridium sp.]|nr:Maf-like protein [Clostridium sp.]